MGDQIVACEPFQSALERELANRRPSPTAG